jgi:hypothetical protein
MKRQRVLDLRPTQFAIGMTEVEGKAKKLRRLSKRKLAKYVKQNPVAVVRAPHGDLYVIDHHHTLMAYWLIGVKRATVKVRSIFPADIRGLSDDPYRSLAWLAQRARAFGESKVPYYEFGWAQLLRRRKLLSPHGRPQLRRALPRAIRICRSPAARKLPGYLGARALQ